MDKNEIRKAIVEAMCFNEKSQFAVLRQGGPDIISHLLKKEWTRLALLFWSEPALDNIGQFLASQDKEKTRIVRIRELVHDLRLPLVLSAQLIPPNKN